ncbi:MAG: hypothetical protein A2Y76_03520 [Planctomycetes bacterium RBG_13_60_9]|nr:MAG: hypothetical protein A2Y76_03520 [Planctomycetes bacterium RBG_13_60_9]
MASQSRHRTEQKLRYATVHLDELDKYPNATSNDEWENAHQESCFFHLAGAVEGLLHEINDGYSLGLNLTDVTWTKIDRGLKQSNQSSPAFDHLTQLKDDPMSWLALLFEWRNHGTHRARVAKMINVSTRNRVDNQFKDPRSGQPSNIYPGLGCLDILRRFLADVRTLIDDCRKKDTRL